MAKRRQKMNSKALIVMLVAMGPVLIGLQGALAQSLLPPEVPIPETLDQLDGLLEESPEVLPLPSPSLAPGATTPTSPELEDSLGSGTHGSSANSESTGEAASSIILGSSPLGSSPILGSSPQLGRSASSLYADPGELAAAVAGASTRSAVGLGLSLGQALSPLTGSELLALRTRLSSIEGAVPLALPRLTLADFFFDPLDGLADLAPPVESEGFSSSGSSAEPTTIQPAEASGSSSCMSGKTPTVEVLSEGSIKVSWIDECTDETHFHVERTPGSSVQTSANTTSYTDSTIACGTSYTYKVTAHNTSAHANHTGTSSSTSSSSAAASSSPLAPSGLSLAVVSETQIDPSWTDNSTCETDYHIDRSTSPEFPSGSSTTEIITATGAGSSTGARTYSDSALTCATAYYYRVRVHVHSGGQGVYSAYSNVPSASTAFNVPSGLSATPVSESGIDLSWTDNSGCESDYHIERSTDGGDTFSPLANPNTGAGSDTGNRTYSDTTVPCASTAHYKIRVGKHNGNAEGSFSGYSNTATTSTVPNAPTGLSATGVSESGIDLSWTDNSACESDYHIERSTDGGDTFSPLANPNTGAGSDTGNRTYSDTTVPCASTAHYKIRVGKHNGNAEGSFSGYSNTATTSTVPNAPTGLSATGVSESGIDLSWTDNSACESDYHIERAVTSSGPFTPRGEVTGTTFSDTQAVACGTTYYYQVRAGKHGGQEVFSDYTDVTTATTVPNAPTSLSATTVSETRIDLAWTDNSSCEAEFHIERSTDGSTFEVLSTLSSSGANGPGTGSRAFSDTTASCATTYYFRVRAHKHAPGTEPFSLFSNTSTTKSNFNAPSSLTATTASGSQIDLGWTDDSGCEDDVHVERAESSGGPFVQVASGVTGTTFSNTGLSCGTTYFYKVRAGKHFSSEVYSDYSDVAQAATPACPTTQTGGSSSETSTQSSSPSSSSSPAAGASGPTRPRGSRLNESIPSPSPNASPEPPTDNSLDGDTLALSTTDSSIFPGDLVGISGDGFAPGSQIVITFESTPVVIGRVTAEASGRFATEVAVPQDATPGSHTIKASGKAPDGSPRVISVPIEIASAEEVTASPASPTGVRALPILATLLLLVTTFGAILVGRKRPALRV